MHPSVKDLLNAFEALPVQKVIILPNNKNVVLAAEQAAEMSAKEVRVVPTRTMPQGVAALLAGLNARPRTTYLAAVRNPNPQFERALGRTRKPAVREPGVPRPGGL